MSRPPSEIYRKELTDWLKKVDVLRQENVDLKNQVAEITRRDIDQAVLERMEVFMNHFIHKDAVFALLRHDMAKQQQDLMFERDTGNNTLAWVRLKKLCDDIARIEADFNSLRHEFLAYINKLSLQQPEI